MIPWVIDGPAGLPLLLMEPHGVLSRHNALALRGAEVTVPAGQRMIASSLAAPVGRHEMTFVTTSWAELDFLETFFDARRGKAEGFWFPTWQWEFNFIGYQMPNFNSYYAQVRHTDYCASIYPLGAQYRQLILLYGDSWHLHNVDAVNNNWTPGIDQFHMSGPLGAHSTIDVPLFDETPAKQFDAYRPLWLRWGCFDQDARRADSLNAHAGYFQLQFAMRELPGEVPL